MNDTKKGRVGNNLVPAFEYIAKIPVTPACDWFLNNSAGVLCSNAGICWKNPND